MDSRGRLSYIMISQRSQVGPIEVRKAFGLQGRTRVCAQPKRGHMGPPRQKTNYLYDRSLVLMVNAGSDPGTRARTGKMPVSMGFRSRLPFFPGIKEKYLATCL